MFKFESGNRSEAVVLGAYLEAGFAVSLPFGSGASYDLIVDAGARLLKVQVKTAWLSQGCVQYNCQRRQPSSGLTHRRPYRADEVDYVVAYCPNGGKLYAVPGAGHLTAGRLRIDPAKNCQEKLVRWAKDYTWERHVEELKI
jgi:hypothetical protein